MATTGQQGLPPYQQPPINTFAQAQLPPHQSPRYMPPPGQMSDHEPPVYAQQAFAEPWTASAGPQSFLPQQKPHYPQGQPNESAARPPGMAYHTPLWNTPDQSQQTTAMQGNAAPMPQGGVPGVPPSFGGPPTMAQPIGPGMFAGGVQQEARNGEMHGDRRSRHGRKEDRHGNHGRGRPGRRSDKRAERRRKSRQPEPSGFREGRVCVIL